MSVQSRLNIYNSIWLANASTTHLVYYFNEIIWLTIRFYSDIVRHYFLLFQGLVKFLSRNHFQSSSDTPNYERNNFTRWLWAEKIHTVKSQTIWFISESSKYIHRCCCELIKIISAHCITHCNDCKFSCNLSIRFGCHR